MVKLYFKEEGFVEPEDAIYYLLAQDGLYQVKRNACFRSALRVDGVGHLLEHQEDVEMLLPPIPASLTEEVIAFFRQVYRRLRSEAVVLLYFSPEAGQYQAVVPIQYVNDSECDYEVGATPPGWQLMGTIHSHCRGPAYHSTADDLDEGEMEGLHITIGNLLGPLSFSCSLVVDFRRAPLDPKDALAGYPDLGHQRKGFRLVDQWMQSVKRKPLTIDVDDIETLLMATPEVF